MQVKITCIFMYIDSWMIFINAYFQGFVLGDMAALVAHAKREAFRRVLKLW